MSSRPSPAKGCKTMSQAHGEVTYQPTTINYKRDLALRQISPRCLGSQVTNQRPELKKDVPLTAFQHGNNMMILVVRRAEISEI
jgi:hypothetical protein